LPTHRSVRFLWATFYRVVTNADYPPLEKVAESAIKDRQKFERLVVAKEKLLEMFHVG
jgi:threonyl-tRNA synthetase